MSYSINTAYSAIVKPYEVSFNGPARNEDNDCTVRSFATVIGKYETAHKMMKDAGRQDRKGAHIFSMKEVAQKLGMEQIHGYVGMGNYLEFKNGKNGFTAQSFIDKFKDGDTMYVFTVKGHAMATGQGKFSDIRNFSGRKRIDYIWALKSGKAAAAPKKEKLNYTEALSFAVDTLRLDRRNTQISFTKANAAGRTEFTVKGNIFRIENNTVHFVKTI